MTNVHDVADYIIAKADEAGVNLNVLKLQKLIYYCQAWHLAFGDGPLFNSKFQAWVHGPVSRKLYDRFNETKSLYSPLSNADIRPEFNAKSITRKARQHVDSILETYLNYTGDQLENMTHREKPWREARGSLMPHERCETIISEDTMKSFYARRLTKK